MGFFAGIRELVDVHRAVDSGQCGLWAVSILYPALRGEDAGASKPLGLGKFELTLQVRLSVVRNCLSDD